MTNEEAIKFAKEQTHIFGGTMKEFMNFVIQLLEERTQGEWIANPLGDYVCNKCSWVVGKFERNFCPNCGTKMKGGAKNGENDTN